MTQRELKDDERELIKEKVWAALTAEFEGRPEEARARWGEAAVLVGNANDPALAWLKTRLWTAAGQRDPPQENLDARLRLLEARVYREAPRSSEACPTCHYAMTIAEEGHRVSPEGGFRDTLLCLSCGRLDESPCRETK